MEKYIVNIQYIGKDTIGNYNIKITPTKINKQGREELVLKSIKENTKYQKDEEFKKIRELSPWNKKSYGKVELVNYICNLKKAGCKIRYSAFGGEDLEEICNIDKKAEVWAGGK